MKRYEEYKDSGIEWIGEIPEEWEMYKIKYLINNYKAGPFGSSLITSNLLSDGNILVYTPEHIANMTTNLSNNLYLPNERKEEMSQFLVRHGDLIFPIVGSLGRAMFISDEMPEGIINQRLAKFRLKENLVDKNFFIYYFVKCNLVKEYIDVNSRGAIIVNLTKDIVTSMYIPLPPFSAQQSIASFLDAKTKPIDDIISKREKQIELLEEMKSAIISHAVTKGLNSNAKMKDSGIEWIGDIPEEWSMIKTSLLFGLIGSGTTPPKNGTNYADEGLCWLQTGDLNDGYISDTSKYITESAIQENSALTLFSKGSLVIAMYGATIGKIGILDIDCYTNQACCVLGKGKKINIKYAFYTYQACKSALINESRGGGQPNISQDIIRHFKIPVPPLEEQDYISSYLDTETSKLDSRIAKRRKQIELLHEYKQALITNAVTGKIDVRGFNS